MHIKFPKKKIPNNGFQKYLQDGLGKSWIIDETREDWIVHPPKESGLTYFEKITLINLPKGQTLQNIIGALEKVEDHELHRLMLKESGIRTFIHSQFERYGLNAQLYAYKTSFNIKPLSKFEDDEKKFFEEIKEGFDLSEAIVYKKNLLPYFIVLAIIKMSYHLQKIEGPFEKYPHTAFWGTIPNPLDFGTYLDPFLTMTPTNIALPFDRLSSGIVLVPSQTITVPYEANAGFGELFMRTPSGYMDPGTFYLFGNQKVISRIQSRRFVRCILFHLNKLIEWTTNLNTSSDAQDNFNDAFAIQLLASIHGIFSSFNRAGRNLDQDEKAIHIFMAFDRISNLSVAYHNLKNGGGTDSSQLEAKCFQALLSNKMMKWAAATIREKFGDRDISHLVASSGTCALEEFINSVKELGPDPANSVRIIRNLAHGSFLKNDKFLRTFESQEARLSPKLPLVLYTFMVAIIINPSEFLVELHKYGTES